MAKIIWTIAAAFLLATPALAHDSWISRGGYKNASGEWCCGDYDCHAVKPESSTPAGWMVKGELVPFDEVILDKNKHAVSPPDGGVVVCRRPDGTRRCVFGLKPGF